MMPKQELFLNVMTDPFGLVRSKSYTDEEFPTNWETFSATAIDITPLNGFERTIARCIKTHLPMRVLRYEKYTFKRPILHVGYRHHRLGNEYFTSHLKEQGGVWYGDQHGGGYGMFQVPDLKHEYEPVNKYITWGWKQPEYERDIFIPLPSPYLSCRRAESSTNRETLVFITEPVTTLHPFRQHAFGMSVDNVEGLNMRVDFLANLESTPLSKTIYRTKLFPLAHTFDDSRGIKKAFPQIPICPTSEKSFLDIMDETRLLVNESLNSSTLIQALSMDVPTIAYYDPKQATLTSEFSKMAEVLIDAGILHTSPQSAANHANAVWDDVDSWWTSEQCIQAKEAYCRGWALNSPKWYWTWARFLRNTVSKLNRNQ
jgi:putative transferase (TIGR04331 family)